MLLLYYNVLLISSFLLCFVHAWNIPLPGGGRIKVEDGGIVRIQLRQDETSSLLPDVPPVGTSVPSTILESIEVRDTKTMKGFGAFSVEPLEKFTFLGFYEGVVVRSREELETRTQRQLAMDYVMSMDGGATFVDGFDRAQDRTKFSPVHLNHEDRDKEGCNCLRLLDNGNVAFFTSRDISVGEELCFDYGPDYWKGRNQKKI